MAVEAISSVKKPKNFNALNATGGFIAHNTLQNNSVFVKAEGMKSQSTTA